MAYSSQAAQRWAKGEIDRLEADCNHGLPANPTEDELARVTADWAARLLAALPWDPHERDGFLSLAPIHPTDARPGSEAKILVMRDRVKRRESCFHPQDPRFGSPPPAAPQAEGFTTAEPPILRPCFVCRGHGFDPEEPFDPCPGCRGQGHLPEGGADGERRAA